MKLSIQTNVWSEELHESNLSQILKEVQTAGYQGFEIGFKRVTGRHTASELKQMASDLNLEISGIHHGARFNDEAWWATCDNNIREVAAYAAAVETPFLLLSGQRPQKADELELGKRSRKLNELGKICRSEGVTMCYHNHNWEFENDSREMDFLLEYTDPYVVAFMLDIGWVHRAGQDVPATLEKLAARTLCYHVKDETAEHEWTEVGNGVIDFAAAMDVVEKNDPHTWLTVERDKALPNALHSASTSSNYLKSNFAHLF